MTRSVDVQFAVADRRKRGYFTIDNVLLDLYGSQLGAHGIAVYAALARFANQEQECWPTYRTITDRTGVSRRQIVREIEKLEALNIIAVIRRVDDKGQRTSHLYTLLDIVGGGATQAPGGSATQAPGGATQAPKQSLIKKYPPKINNKGEAGKKSYRPAEYADIILG
jgi:DNA-binding MarR family transcriptional regulator